MTQPRPTRSPLHRGAPGRNPDRRQLAMIAAVGLGVALPLAIYGRWWFILLTVVACVYGARRATKPTAGAATVRRDQRN